MFQHAESLPLTLVNLDVHTSPPYIVSASLFVDNTLVLGAASSLLSREVNQSARRRDNGAFIADRIFVELSRGCVALEGQLRHIEAGLREVVDISADNCGT